MLAALGFAVVVPLAASEGADDPVGLRYDDWNRLLTLPLAGLLGATIGYRLQRAGRAANAAILGAALLVVGNVIEFWAALFQSDPVAAIAQRRPGEDEWAGSAVGWFAFSAGLFLLIGASTTHGVRAAREGTLSTYEAVAVIAVPALLLACVVAWATSVVAAIVTGVLLAAALLVVARSLSR